MEEPEYFVYILRCADGTFYVGVTTEPSVRLEVHRQGLDPNAYTYRRRPVQLAWIESFSDQGEALAVEKQLKGWSSAKKGALIGEGLDAVHRVVLAERRRREGSRRGQPKTRRR